MKEMYSAGLWYVYIELSLPFRIRLTRRTLHFLAVRWTSYLPHLKVIWKTWWVLISNYKYCDGRLIASRCWESRIVACHWYPWVTCVWKSLKNNIYTHLNVLKTLASYRITNIQYAVHKQSRVPREALSIATTYSHSTSVPLNIDKF